MLQKQISYVVFGISESNQGSEKNKTPKAPEKKAKNTYRSSQESPNIVFCFSKVLFFFGFLDGVLPKESPNIYFSFSFGFLDGVLPKESPNTVCFLVFSGSWWWCCAE